MKQRQSVLSLVIVLGVFSASLADAATRKKSAAQKRQTQECAFALTLRESPSTTRHFWDVGAESDPVSGSASRRNVQSDVTADEDSRGESEFGDLF